MEPGKDGHSEFPYLLIDWVGCFKDGLLDCIFDVILFVLGEENHGFSDGFDISLGLMGELCFESFGFNNSFKLFF